MSPDYSRASQKHKRLLLCLGAFLFATLLLTGVFARNGWFPTTDSGWFGQRTETSPPPAHILRLSKEYLYAGSRLLAVEDANANAAWPADLAVWRPTTGTWWVMGGAAGSQPATQAWGLPADKPVPGDYDGDGKTDFSVFRPSTGEWYVLQSSDNVWAPLIAWGTPNDILVPADYDGDGKTDRAVWRQSDGIWYIVRSSDGVNTYLAYGVSADKPAPADYDGDGRADVAVWRAAEQRFYWINSASGNGSTVTIAQSAVEPVSADYDGDGRADHAIRNGAYWTIRQSSNGQIVSIAWQQATDVAVQNDYDGDGKCDVAVWRPIDLPAGTVGHWFIRQSASDGLLRQVQWGISGDIPVPAFYRR